jgi:hypothetical protein
MIRWKTTSRLWKRLDASKLRHTLCIALSLQFVLCHVGNESVDQTNDMHRIFDKQNTLCREIFGAQQAVRNWTLICLFAEAALSGASKARLVGAEALSETT